MYKYLFLLLLFVSFSSQASHLAGGEISYQCLGNGNYRFRVVVFRDCSGIVFQQSSITLLGPVPVSCTLVGSFDITSNLGCSTVQCNPPSNYASAKGGLSKFVYEGTTNLSSLVATPVGGYTWTTSNVPCCRNASSNSSCNGDMILRVKMHRFVNQAGTALSPAQLCDNSPTFLEDPNLVVVASPFDTAVFNGFGADNDPGDVLRYGFDFPWNAVGVGCTYTGAYSVNSPLPNIIGSGLDSITGVFRFNPTTIGAFNSAIRVASYRNNQLISEVFRDFQAMVIASPASAPLPYNPTYVPGSLQYQQQQQAPNITGNIVNAVTGFPERTMVLYAGDTMRVDYTVKDSFPVLPTPNRIYSYVRSDVLGALGTNEAAGCAQPPCAIIQNVTTSAPVTLISLRNRQQGYGLAADSAGWDIKGRIYWTPKSVHAQLAGVPAIRKYYFGVFAFDDICPLVGTGAEFFEVNVLPALTRLPAPATLCIEANADRSVQIHWPSIIDTTTLEIGDSLVSGLTRPERLQRSIQRRRVSFVRADLFRMNILNNSLNLRASFTSPDSLQFLDQQLPADSLFAYTLRVISALDTQWVAASLPVVAIQPQVTPNQSNMTFQVNWSSPFTASGSPAAFDGWYYLFSRNVSQQSAWTIIDSVQQLLQITHPMQLSNDTLEFRIAWKSSAACALSYSFPLQTVFPLNMGIAEAAIGMQLYPNPVKNQLNVRYEGLKAPLSWKIYDLSGRLKREGVWQNEPIDVSFLPTANYMLLLDFGNNQLSRAVFNKKD